MWWLCVTGRCSVCDRSVRCDGCVLVTTPQNLAVGDVRRQATFCRRTGLPLLGIVENMSGFVCPHCSVGGGLSGPAARGASRPVTADWPPDPAGGARPAVSAASFSGIHAIMQRPYALPGSTDPLLGVS